MSEYGRRAVHASGVGMPLLYLLDLATWNQLRYFMLGVTAVAFVLEFLRLVVGLNHWLYDELTRPYEADSVAGYAFYMLSVTLVAVTFGPSVTLPAVLMLAVADPISGALSDNGAHEHKRPAVIGATFGLCFLLAVPFTVAWSDLAVGAAAAAGGALLGAIADGIKPIIRGVAVDDNLTIPLAAAVGIAGVFWLLGVDTGFDPFGF
jgi:dolichol kinase